MKLPSHALRLVLLVCACALPVPASAADKNASPNPGTLQVQVNIPPTWRPMLEDRIADAFVSRLGEVFDRRGFEGRIQEVDALDEPASGCCLLTINLLEWRMDHVGNIECTFSASLQTDHAIRQLGVFTGTAFRWMNMPGRFGLADTFSDAADQALRDLYAAVRKTGLLPAAKKR